MAKNRDSQGGGANREQNTRRPDYRSGPGRLVPEKLEIGKLPKHARVAFAGRCLRRIQPLFRADWPDAPEEYSNKLDYGFQRIEGSATGDSIPLRLSAATKNEHVAGQAVNKALGEQLLNLSVLAKKAGADKAAAVARAAAFALRATAGSGFIENTPGFVSIAAQSHEIDKAMRRDLELLHLIAVEQKWEPWTPVPPEVFGPMWPDGVPDGWPTQSSSTLAGLPHYAKVAVAIRATRRVQSLLELDIASKHEGLQRGIERVLTALEQAMSSGHVIESYAELSKEIGFNSEHGRTNPIAGLVLTEVLFATQQALTTFLALSGSTAEQKTDTQAALESIAWAERAMEVAKIETASRVVFGNAVASDVQILARLSRKHKWNDSDPVDLAVSGALWPNGIPDGWPPATKAHRKRKQKSRRSKLVIKFTVPPMEDTPENRASFREHVKSVILAANQLHIAKGGGGLKVRDVKTWLPQPVPVEAGGGR